MGFVAKQTRTAAGWGNASDAEELPGGTGIWGTAQGGGRLARFKRVRDAEPSRRRGHWQPQRSLLSAPVTTGMSEFPQCRRTASRPTCRRRAAP
jgi:hypothetical protein